MNLDSTVPKTDAALPSVSIWRRLAPALILLAVVLCLYGRTLDHALLNWDDDLHLSSNPHLQPLTAAGFRHLWTSGYENLYIPVSYTFFAAETFITHQLKLTTPRVYRAGSLLLHLACALLVFRLLKRWLIACDSLPLDAVRSASIRDRVEIPALMGTLLFAVHPLQVETVAWTSETRGLLAALFSFMALDWLGRNSAAGTILLGAGLLSKPSAASAVPAAAIVDSLLNRKDLAHIVRQLLPAAVLVVIDVALTKSLQSDVDLTMPIPTLPQRLVVAGDTLTFSLQKLIWPVNLAIDYGRTPAVCLADRFCWVWVLVPLIVTAFLALFRAPRVVWTAWFLWIAGLLPVLGLMPFAFQAISTFADRYTYPAMLGPALLLAWFCYRQPHRLSRGVVLAGLLVLAGLAWRQAGVWHDAHTLYAHCLSVNPHSSLSLNNQGDLLSKAGQSSAAIDRFREALRVNPRYARAACNLGVALRDRGDLVGAHAAFQQAVDLKPANALFQLTLAESWLSRNETSKARQHFELALKSDPGNSATLNQLGLLAANAGETDDAESLYGRALDHSPDFWPARVNLGSLYLVRGHLDDARFQFEEALRLNPDQPAIALNLGLIAARQNRLDDAQQLLERARKSDADSKIRQSAEQELLSVLNVRGLAEHRSGNWDAAEKHFRAALHIDPRFAAAHFNFARLLSDRRQPRQAEEHLRKVLTLVPADSPAAADVAAELEKLLRSPVP